MPLPLTKLGRDVFAPTDAAGSPRSVDNGDAVVLATEYEALLKALVAGAGGITLLPDIINAVNAGAGTADAIQATAVGDIATAAYSQLITVNFTAANTGPMTISINGETPRPLVTNTGQPVPTGYVSAGMAALVQIDSAGNYRLFSYGDATAIQAAAEAILADFKSRYLGAFEDDAAATEAVAGSPLIGAEYWNTTVGKRKTWDGTVWQVNSIALNDGDVTGPKLADEAVTGSKLADDAVTGAKLADDAVTDPKVAAFDPATSVDAGKIAIRRGSWQTPLIAQFYGKVNAREAGATSDPSVDSSAAIQEVLDSSPRAHVIVDVDARCDSMIELNEGRTLEMTGGAALRRLSAHSASTDPVVWIKGSQAAMKGAGFIASLVKTENRCPRGIIRLGHKDMTESHADMQYCLLADFDLQGPQSGGQTSGEADVALYMANPQLGGRVSYFHIVRDIRMIFTNIGLYLHGWANGNFIRGLHGLAIGNVTHNAITSNALILCEGLDNNITDVFFHQSPNTAGVVVRNFDNTANGGHLHEPQANSMKGMIFEQGGASAVGLWVVNSFLSNYEVVSNTLGGNVLPSGFDTTMRNTLISP